MARKSVSDCKSEEIKRLKCLGLSKRQVARAMKVHRRTVDRHLGAIESEKKERPLSPFWTESVLWKDVISEISRGVPAKVLWEELKESGKVPVAYQNFVIQLRKRLPPSSKVTMHRKFRPGERCEVDYCNGIDILDPLSGQIVKTHLFVGALCFSRYTFAEFSLTQKSEDFLESHRRMFEFFGGVPHVISPDNLKSAVSKAHCYDPDVNKAYVRLASHYQCAVVPARVQRPKDKAIVERTIQSFQRWYFFKVRHRTFTSIVELNQSLVEHLEIFNAKIHRIFQRSRKEMFETEKDRLIALPQEPYRIQVHHVATLHPDCHLAFEHNFYSAPYELRGKKLDLWVSFNTVEIFDNGERIAFHHRSRNRGSFVTNRAHYPKEHQAYWDSSAKSLRTQAAKLGPQISKLIHKLLSGPYPLQNVRRCQGILRLSNRYDKKILNQACELAMSYDRSSVQFVERLAKFPELLNREEGASPTRHENPYLRKSELF